MSSTPYSQRINTDTPRSFDYHQSQSTVQARASYPVFLSLPETLTLQISYAWRGFVDANRWGTVISTVVNDPEIRTGISKSVLLNSLSLISIYAFDHLLQPLIRDQQKWLHRNVGWFYRVMWLFPVVGISLYLNSSWCKVIADRTYTLRHGGRKVAAPPSYSGILTALATSAYRAVMICTSVLISFGLAYVPVIGGVAGFAFFCWVDAYYCFEFIWIARGLSLAQRIRHLEERWAYYFAFGFPSSALCIWGSTLANAALFALLLPSYIIMAMHARPHPTNPYNPLSDASDNAYSQSSHSTTRYPSPFIPIRLPVFAPVLWLNDRIVHLLSVGGGRSQQYTYGSGAELKSKHRRELSDDTAGNIEEGNADTSGAGIVYSKTRIRTTLGRSRRKMD